MRVYVILSGDATKPQSDEVKGFVLSPQEARTYCERMNAKEPDGSNIAYYSEPADSIKL